MTPFEKWWGSDTRLAVVAVDVLLRELARAAFEAGERAAHAAGHGSGAGGVSAGSEWVDIGGGVRELRAREFNRAGAAHAAGHGVSVALRPDASRLSEGDVEKLRAAAEKMIPLASPPGGEQMAALRRAVYTQLEKLPFDGTYPAAGERRVKLTEKGQPNAGEG